MVVEEVVTQLVMVAEVVLVVTEPLVMDLVHYEDQR